VLSGTVSNDSRKAIIASSRVAVRPHDMRLRVRHPRTNAKEHAPQPGVWLWVKVNASDLLVTPQNIVVVCCVVPRCARLRRPLQDEAPVTRRVPAQIVDSDLISFSCHRNPRNPVTVIRAPRAIILGEFASKIDAALHGYDG
jgi:hypothetical protein